MDNVKFHKFADINELIKNIDYEIMSLPPYSLFWNPIESMFSEHKEITKHGNPQKVN